MSSPQDSADTPLHTRTGELVRRTAVTIDRWQSVAEAAHRMQEAGVGSLVVTAAEGPVGIVTESDLTRRVLAAGRSPQTPVSEVMSPDPVGIGAERPLFETLLTMIRRGIGHLLVWDDARLVGVVSERDWLMVQQRHPALQIAEIDRAESVAALAELRRRALLAVAGLFAGAGDAEWLGELIAEVNDRVTGRVIELALGEAEAAAGPCPVRFAWVAMGSEGRREQAPATDQDNGIVYAAPEGDEAVARAWLAPFAERVVAGLAHCGFPRCTGNVMATNPALCQPLEGWQAMFTGLIADPDPEALLRAAIYFDFRAVWGEAALVERLREWLLERIAHNRGFLKRLAGGVMTSRPPVHAWSWRLRRWLGLDLGTLNLKREGLLPLVHGVRLLALDHGVAATGTVARLAGIADAAGLSADRAAAVRGAFLHISGIRLQRQFAQLERGEPPGNNLPLRELDPLQRRFLVESLHTVCEFQDALAGHYGAVAPD